MALSTQIETIRVFFAILKDDVHKIRHRVTSAEQRISTVEDELNSLLVHVRDVAVDHKSHKAKLGDIEDWLRRNNLHFLGYPKGSEGKHPEKFLLVWLKQLLEQIAFPICLL